MLDFSKKVLILACKVLSMEHNKMNKRSYVWNYFRTSDSSDSKVTCTICKAELAYSNSTGSMLNHLKNKHPGCSADHGQSTSTDTRAGRKTISELTTRHCTPGKAQQITNKLADMIAVDMLPISVVEGTGFRALMAVVEPGYVVPGRKHITSRLEERCVKVFIIHLLSNQ